MEYETDGHLVRLLTETRDGEETGCLYDLCGNRLEKGKGVRQRDTNTTGKTSWSAGGEEHYDNSVITSGQNTCPAE